MRGFRAKDADRDACVELIEAAFVDGQLNSADRDLRVGRALSAETVDELQTLTRDLQLPPGAVVPTNTSASVQRTRPALAPRVVGGVFALVVVGVVLFIGVVAVTMFASLGGESSSDVDRGKLTHVLVNRWFDDQAAVNIYIGNQFGESGYLRTTPSGEVVRAYPYDGDSAPRTLTVSATSRSSRRPTSTGSSATRTASCGSAARSRPRRSTSSTG